MNEIWKPVKRYEGFYEVSNLGRVKSLNRILPCGRRVKAKMLSPGLSSNGYLSLVLCNVKKETANVHILVAESFKGHERCKFDVVVNHIDFDRTNNSEDNLELVSNRVNTDGKHLKEGKSSQYTGVTYVKSKDRWQATIRIKGKPNYLGRHKKEYDAHLAYEAALKELEKPKL